MIQIHELWNRLNYSYASDTVFEPKILRQKCSPSLPDLPKSPDSLYAGRAWLENLRASTRVPPDEILK